jgi:hypothetical protein
MLINCPDCDSEVSDLASACPRCARPIADPILLKVRQPAIIQKPDDEKVALSNPFARSDGYARKASWLLLAAVPAALIAVAIYRSNNSPPEGDHPTTTDQAYGHCSKQQYEADHLQMELAFGTGILKNDAKGSGLGVFISEAYWNQMTFEQKTRFAEAFDCAIAGVGKSIAEMKFRSDRTGKTIGEWSWGTLTVP